MEPRQTSNSTIGIGREGHADEALIVAAHDWMSHSGIRNDRITFFDLESSCDADVQIWQTHPRKVQYTEVKKLKTN